MRDGPSPRPGEPGEQPAELLATFSESTAPLPGEVDHDLPVDEPLETAAAAPRGGSGPGVDQAESFGDPDVGEVIGRPFTIAAKQSTTRFSGLPRRRARGGGKTRPAPQEDRRRAEKLFSHVRTRFRW